jgi:hypothetical protein
MKILLTFLPILALSLARLNAIGISLDRIDFTTSHGGIVTRTEISTPSFIVEVTNPFTTRISMGWAFTNTANEAFFDGSWFLLNRGTGLSFPSETSVNTTYRFTLTEAVNFAVNGAVGFLDDGIGLNSLNALIGPNPTFGSSVQLEFGTILSASLPSITGMLAPGQHFFITDGVMEQGGRGRGFASLRLTPIATPDGGSTLMLLGLAICAIGGIFGKLRALSNC